MQLNTDRSSKPLPWLVIVTRTRYEKMVAKQLERLGISCYLPLKKTLNQWHDRKKWVTTPLLSSYLFVQIEASERNRVFDVPGVLRYLRNDGGYAQISEAEIERIQAICAYHGAVEVMQDNLSKGDDVAVKEGVFKGFTGKVVEKSNNKYIKIALKSINAQILVQIPQEQLMCINEPK
ncbi:MAG: UpxY family transcription antiterminator [Chitinophagaceae bacterium]|nr:MAG: UpxY family transcription antiterminator [Chitinophagaceae bacterium]